MEKTKRVQIRMPGNFHQAFSVWRKELNMSWDTFGLYLADTANRQYEQNGIVEKFVMLEGDGRIKKNVAFSENVFRKLILERGRRKCNWNKFWLQALSFRKVKPLESYLREEVDRHKGFLVGEYAKTTFYLSPSVAEMVKKKSIDEAVEDFLLRQYKKLERPQRQEQKNLPEAMLPAQGSREEKSLEARPLVPQTPQIPEEKSPEREESISEEVLTGKAFLLAKEKWIEQGKKYSSKSSEPMAWPKGSRARLLLKEDESHRDYTRGIRLFFIYELQMEDDTNFLKPYRLELRLERKIIPRERQRVDEKVFIVKTFQFKNEKAARKMLQRKEEIFEKMTTLPHE